MWAQEWVYGQFERRIWVSFCLLFLAKTVPAWFSLAGIALGTLEVFIKFLHGVNLVIQVARQHSNQENYSNCSKHNKTKEHKNRFTDYLKHVLTYTKHAKLTGKNTNPKTANWSLPPQNHYQGFPLHRESNGQLQIESDPDTPKLQLISIVGVYLNLQYAQTARKSRKTLTI